MSIIYFWGVGGIAVASGGPVGLPGNPGKYMGGSGKFMEGPGGLGSPVCPGEPKNRLGALLELNPNNTPG